MQLYWGPQVAGVSRCVDVQGMGSTAVKKLLATTFIQRSVLCFLLESDEMGRPHVPVQFQDLKTGRDLTQVEQ